MVNVKDKITFYNLELTKMD